MRSFRRLLPLCLIIIVNSLLVDPKRVLDPPTIYKIQRIVDERASCRKDADYARADQLMQQIQSIDPRIRIQDLARTSGGGSTWSIEYVQNDDSSPSVLQLAHQALGYAVHCANQQEASSPSHLQSIINDAKDQLRAWKDETEFYHVETTLRGRKAADSAFWFSMAGVDDDELFELLTDVCAKELERFGSRSSCRIKDVLNIVEQLAASGVRESPELLRVAHEALESKGYDKEVGMNLHDDYVALRLWKFSARQKKQKSFLDKAAKHWERDRNFDEGIEKRESSKKLEGNTPLFVDIGCGMGVSLLGLAQQYPDCRLVGVDLSSLAIGYARGIASRWKLDNLSYHVDDASVFLQSLDAYEGPVKQILIQFPTPYRLEVEGAGNSQLPSSAKDGFMVSEELLKQCHSLLKKHPEASLLLQSNCEDVALYMRELAEKVGFRACKEEDPTVYLSEQETERTLRWLQMGGKRARGEGWRTRVVLPRRGRTETEIACMMNGTPVHRCLLVTAED